MSNSFLYKVGCSFLNYHTEVSRLRLNLQLFQVFKFLLKQQKMAYKLRQGQKKNYKDLADTKLPRARRSVKQNTDKLYAIEIMEANEDKVKIHYTGYSSKYDEWRAHEDIVEPSSSEQSSGHNIEPYQPFNVHTHLAYAIKSSLCSGRERDPAVRIEVPFDKLVFQGGLKSAGKLVRIARGEEHYAIEHFQDLVPYLGEQWYIRGLNAHLDFCAVLVETVSFYLHKKAPIVDHLMQTTIGGGYVLIFKFVRFDGVKDQLSDFGISI